MDVPGKEVDRVFDFFSNFVFQVNNATLPAQSRKETHEQKARVERFNKIATNCSSPETNIYISRNSGKERFIGIPY